ncbi:MAG: glycosyltransferase [Gemmatimonadales bacterium]
MRVLQVDSGREWRGGQNQVRLLTRHLARPAGESAGPLEQRLFTRANSELARRAAADGVDVRGSPWTLSLDPRALWRLFVEILAFRPDIVHAHDSHALRLASWARDLGAASGSPAYLVGTRRVDFRVRRGSAWFRAERVIAISEAVRAVLLADGLPESVVRVVPSGIDPQEVHRAAAAPLDVRARLGLAAGTPLAVNVAALVDHKDQRTLLRAADAARTLRPDLHWAIAGEGELQGSLVAELARLDLADRVHFLGYIEEADALIREADVFVMSSKEEGLGSVILHALALEKPVVATAGGGIPEILPAEALVPVGDAVALAHKVVAALGRPAPFPLPPQFTARAMAEGVVAVYRSLV